jgi:hypothetical protein
MKEKRRSNYGIYNYHFRLCVGKLYFAEGQKMFSAPGKSVENYLIFAEWLDQS